MRWIHKLLRLLGTNIAVKWSLARALNWYINVSKILYQWYLQLDSFWSTRMIILTCDRSWCTWSASCVAAKQNQKYLGEMKQPHMRNFIALQPAWAMQKLLKWQKNGNSLNGFCSKQTCVFSGIQFTRHFIKIVVVETKQIVSSNSNMIQAWRGKLQPAFRHGCGRQTPSSRARSREDETQNGERNANRNPEWWGDFSQLVKIE